MTSASGINFVDIPRQYADVEQELITGLTEIIRKSTFVGGSHVEQFGAKLAGYAGTKYAVGCSDGTAALKLSLLAAGIAQGDGVIVPANSFIASAFGVTHAGGKPIFVDCDGKTYLIDLNQVEDVLKSGQAKFIMPVHLYGNPCPMDQVMKLADKYGAKVIEDNAQALGAEVDGQRTGSFGLAAGVSFYPTKNLGAFGQGGAILTNDEKLAANVRMYSEQGQGATRYQHDVIGYNDRLHSIQAFVLTVLIDNLDDLNAKRLQCADRHAQELPEDRLQQRTPNANPVYHLFEFRCNDQLHRAHLADALKKRNIGFEYHYPIPIHKQAAYAEHSARSLPNAETLAECLLSLAIHPYLMEEEIAVVCSTMAEAESESSEHG